MFYETVLAVYTCSMALPPPVQSARGFHGVIKSSTLTTHADGYVVFLQKSDVAWASKLAAVSGEITFWPWICPFER